MHTQMNGDVLIGSHIHKNAHTCMSRQQSNLVYILWIGRTQTGVYPSLLEACVMLNADPNCIGQYDMYLLYAFLVYICFRYHILRICYTRYDPPMPRFSKITDLEPPFWDFFYEPLQRYVKHHHWQPSLFNTAWP